MPTILAFLVGCVLVLSHSSIEVAEHEKIAGYSL